MSEDGIQEIITFVDEYGFEEKEQPQNDIFALKPFSIEGFPTNENLITFALNDHNIVFTTDRKKIYRWRFKEDDGCVELPIQNEVEGDFADQFMKLSGQVGKQIGGTILSTVSKVTKPLFNTTLRRDKRAESQESKLDCIFLEPRGYHIIITSRVGEVFHACRDEMEVRELEGIDNSNIRFLLFGECTIYSFSNTILVSSTNKFYSYNLTYNNEKVAHIESLSKQIFQINETEKILDVKKVVKNSIHNIIILTDRFIYVLNGTKDLFRLFQKYQEAPDLLAKSRVPLKDKSFTPKLFIGSKQLIWTNGTTIMHSNCEGVIENYTFQDYQELKYYKKSYDNTKTEQIYGVGITQYHYYLLTFDALTIINLLTQEIQASFDINPNNHGKALGMVYDIGTECFWIWCTKGIFRLNVEFEDRDAWKTLYDLKQYENALEVAKKYECPYYGHIATAYADLLFHQAKDLNPNKDEGNEQIQGEQIDDYYIRNRHNKNIQNSLNEKPQKITNDIIELKKELYKKAAIYYFCSCKPYEEVILQYEMGELDYNRISLIEGYLKPILELIEIDVKQIIISKILELMMIEINYQQIKSFLEKYKNDIQVEIAMPILEAHGLFKLQTYFIELKQDHKTVIQSLLIQEDYRSVQSKLSSLNDEILLLNIVYKYSYVIMKYNTQQTLDLFKRCEKLEPQKLVSILLDIPQQSKDLAIKFMQYCIFIRTKKIIDVNFNNLYLQYMSDLNEIEQIMYYLSEQNQQHENGEKFKFDLNYASQLFFKKNQLQPYVYILQMLGDFENAIKIAIEINLVEDAKNIALKCEDLNKQRQLWILQMRLMLEKGGQYVKQIVQLTREIPLIKAEDLLPYLNENIKLDDFKEEICETLEEYHSEIEKQQQDLEGYIKSNESLKRLSLQTANRYIIVQQKQKCENCFRGLFQEDFIIFECNHGFHKECIIQYIKFNPNVLEQKAFSSLLYLEQQIILLEKNQQQKQQIKSDESLLGFLMTNSTNSNKETLNKNDQRYKLQEELDEIISRECPICGIYIIDQILLPLDNDEYIEESWDI